MRLDVHRRSDTRKERKHRCHIRDVVYECRDEDRTPDDYCEHNELVVAADTCNKACEVIDDPGFPDRSDNHKEA